MRRPRFTAKLLLSVAVAGATMVAMPTGPAWAATSTLRALAPLVASYPSVPLTFSGTGNVTGVAQFVDVQIPPNPTPSTSTSGCEAADFAGFAAGRIAVVQRGTCTFAVKAANAQAAGAVAVVIFNEGQPGRTEVLGGTLGGPGITKPVVGTSFAAAQELFTIGPNVTLQVIVGASVCDAPPATGTAVPGKNLVVAQPGTVTFGTEGPDVIYGTAGPDRLAGLGGDDLIFGLGGADQISGGEGADTLCGGADNDDITGGAGADELSGDLGSNRLAGGDGIDVCTGFTAAASCENEPV